MRGPHARFDPDVFRARRGALRAALGDAPAVFPAGAAPSRNYRATRYPFRASSHFLHLVGLPLERAHLVYAGGDFTLYVPEPDDDDALWHGPTPTLEALAAWTGLVVRPRSALVSLPRGAACPPIRDVETLAELGAWLGRAPSEPPRADEDVALAHALVDVRLRHDAFAMGEIRHAIAATGRAFAAGVAATSSARTMREVRAAMLAVFEHEGLSPAYGAIITTRGEILHTEDASDDVLPGALVLADVGAESPLGYAADVTRTWPTSTASATQSALLALVKRAQDAAIGCITPGVRYRDVHTRAARALAEGLVALGIFTGDPEERVADGTIALLFPHGVGHLLGLDVHDMEDLGDLPGYGERARDTSPTYRYLRLDRPLAEDMVVTVEPGLYFVPASIDRDDVRRRFGGRVRWDELDRFRDVRGIRIEDDVRVTSEGAEVLSASIPYATDGASTALV